MAQSGLTPNRSITPARPHQHRPVSLVATELVHRGQHVGDHPSRAPWGSDRALAQSLAHDDWRRTAGGDSGHQGVQPTDPGIAVSRALLGQISDDWEMATFPYIDGRNPDFIKNGERAQIAEVVGQLHAHTPQPTTTPRWAPGYRKPELIQLLATQLDEEWNVGPYASRAGALLRECLPGIRKLLQLHGMLTTQLLASDQPLVITHGEPHGGNTMIDNTRQVHLIDCDDIMLAPPERDLWLLLHIGHQRPLSTDNTPVLDAYQRTAGDIEPRSAIIELMRADWHLQEISAYAHDFSQPHQDSDDLAAHWHTLNSYLPVAQNWTASPLDFANR